MDLGKVMSLFQSSWLGSELRARLSRVLMWTMAPTAYLMLPRTVIYEVFEVSSSSRMRLGSNEGDVVFEGRREYLGDRWRRSIGGCEYHPWRCPGFLRSGMDVRQTRLKIYLPAFRNTMMREGFNGSDNPCLTAQPRWNLLIQ